MQTLQGKVLKLYISTGNPTQPRKETKILHVDPKGIEGDKFYAKDSNRSILLSCAKSYKMAEEVGIALPEGKLGENIYIDIDPYSLAAGDRLTIGNIEFEVTQNCTLCKGLSQIDSKLPKLLKDDRGIFIKALSSGTIHLNDPVCLNPAKDSS